MAQDDGKLARVRTALERHDLAAVVAADQDNFFYTSGYMPPGRAGASLTVTPRSGEQAMIVSGFEESVAGWASWIADVRAYQNWVEVHDVADLRADTTRAVPKPVQFSKETIYAILAEVLRERGLAGERVGIEMSSLAHQDYLALTKALPDVRWVNSKPIMYEARAVKTASEIQAMRVATGLAEIGHQAVVAGPRGKTIQELRLDYRTAVYEAARTREDAHGALDVRSYITAGPRVGPNLLRDPHRVADGDVIYIDSGVTVDGYASDVGRSYAVGQVDELATRIHGALLEGYEAGLAMLRPGVPMRDVFAEINRTIQRTFPTYTRGHFGHVPGIGFGEQPPFFAPHDEAILEENMVLNIETPYYVKGLGGFQIEDMLLITADGYECWNRTPRGMVRV
jgi:Xaa-Pro aminopeptidase